MKHLYFSACDINGGIYHYTLENNFLVFRNKLLLDRPMYMVISGRKAFIILRQTDSVNNFGGLITYDIDDSGDLINPSEISSTHGVVPCHLSVVDDSVYVVNYLSGNVVKMPDKVVMHTGHGKHPTRQEAAHTHFVCPSLDNQFILVTDLGMDTIFVYDKELNELSEAKVPEGCGARHFVFSQDGKYLYCVNELSSTVSVFSFSKGKMKLLGNYDIIPDFSGQSTAAAIRICGEYLYVSNRGADCISRMKICGEKLELMENTPCGGNSPRDFIICDDMLFCTNETSNSITVLKLKNGKPVLTDNVLKVENPLCACELELS